MEPEITFECPYCGHSNSSPADPVEGVQEWTTDCENCCRPTVLRVVIKRGEIVEMDFKKEQD